MHFPVNCREPVRCRSWRKPETANHANYRKFPLAKPRHPTSRPAHLRSEEEGRSGSRQPAALRSRLRTAARSCRRSRWHRYNSKAGGVTGANPPGRSKHCRCRRGATASPFWIVSTPASAGIQTTRQADRRQSACPSRRSATTDRAW